MWRGVGDGRSGPGRCGAGTRGAFRDLEGGMAWVGFTASTGASYQNHEVLSWVFYERRSEHAAVAAGAGNHLTKEQDATLDLESRWRDEVFARVREKGEL